MSDLHENNPQSAVDVYNLVCKGRFTHIEDDHKELKASMANIQKTQTYIMTKIDNGFTSKINDMDKKVDSFKTETHNDITGIRKLFLKLMFVIMVFILGLLGTVVTQYVKDRASGQDESTPEHKHVPATRQAYSDGVVLVLE